MRSRSQPPPLHAVSRVLPAQRPQAQEAVLAQEPHPHRPQRERHPRPAQAAPQAVFGRGVAGEAVAADARADVAHDFPVLSTSGAGRRARVPASGPCGLGSGPGGPELQRHLDRAQGLGQGADLVHLDEDRVRDPRLDPAREALDVGDEQVVADQLEARAEPPRERGPAVPVVLGQAVLDAHDRIAVAQARVVLDQLGRAQPPPPLAREDVGAVLPEFARGRIEGERHLLARLVARLLDRLDQAAERVLVRLEIGREPALVADPGREPALLEHRGQGVEHLGRPAHRLAAGGRAERDDHELLEVHVVVRVPAAVQDVHERHRQRHGVHPAEVAVERDLERGGGGLGRRERDAKQRVRAQLALVRRAVQLDQGAVDPGLVEGVHAEQPRRDGLEHVPHRLLDPLAPVAPGVAIPELDRLVLAGRSPRGDGRASERSARQAAVHLERGIAARVEDLARVERGDRHHGGGRLSSRGERTVGRWSGRRERAPEGRRDSGPRRIPQAQPGSFSGPPGRPPRAVPSCELQ